MKNLVVLSLILLISTTIAI